MHKLLVILLLLLFPVQAVAELTVGIYPRRSASITKKAFTPFVEGLSAIVGEPVRLAFSPNMKSFRDKYHAGEFDLVHSAQSHYILHRDLGTYRLICANVESGSETMKGALLVRKDSGINAIADLRGKKVMLCDSKYAMGCNVFPTYLLKEAGLEAGRDYTLAFAQSGPGAVIAAFYKQADAAGAGNTIMHMKSGTSKIDMEAMKIIAETKPIKQLPWSVSKALGEEKGTKIREWMLSLDTTPEGRAILREAGIDRFVPAEDADYDSVAEIMETIK